MASISDMHELDALVKAASAQPANIDVLESSVRMIAAANHREIEIRPLPDAASPTLEFLTGDSVYSVSVRDGHYHVGFRQLHERYDYDVDNLELLAWEICGVIVPPAQAGYATADGGLASSRPGEARLFGKGRKDEREEAEEVAIPASSVAQEIRARRRAHLAEEESEHVWGRGGMLARFWAWYTAPIARRRTYTLLTALLIGVGMFVTLAVWDASVIATIVLAGAWGLAGSIVAKLIVKGLSR